MYIRSCRRQPPEKRRCSPFPRAFPLAAYDNQCNPRAWNCSNLLIIDSLPWRAAAMRA